MRLDSALKTLSTEFRVVAGLSKASALLAQFSWTCAYRMLRARVKHPVPDENEQQIVRKFLLSIAEMYNFLDMEIEDI